MCFFLTEQSDVVFIKFQTFHVAVVVKRVFYSVFVWKCSDMCKHCYGVQLFQNPPLCSNTLQNTLKETRETSVNLVSMNCLFYGILLHVRPLQYCIFISNLSSSQYSVLHTVFLYLSFFLSLYTYISPIIPRSSEKKKKSRVKRKRK